MELHISDNKSIILFDLNKDILNICNIRSVNSIFVNQSGQNSENMNYKKEKGQFYTTNYDKILTGINSDSIKTNYTKIIEPFVGRGDLLYFINDKFPNYKIKYYDIDMSKFSYENYPSKENIDTLLYPPNYKDSIVITNPPYLARNKSKDKTIFDKYEENDLYKCFIKSIIDKTNGGILIIPLNFFCNIRKSDLNLRNKFLSKYHIDNINVFEEPVFNDTGYTVCSFAFYKKSNEKQCIEEQNIKITFFPSEKEIKITLKKSENWIIGYNIYNTIQNQKIIIKRLLENEKPTSNILLKSIDSCINNRLCLEYVSDDKIFYGKDSSRDFATINWNLKLNKDDQIVICKMFNNFINRYRNKYNSLFLTNYRENSRKRISFELAFRIINTAIQIYLYKKKLKLEDFIIN